MSSFDWQRGKQRDHDLQETERLQQLGIEHGEPQRKKKAKDTKKVHPNSMAARKWGRTDWNT
jgi:hypothetical protein